MSTEEHKRSQGPLPMRRTGTRRAAWHPSARAGRLPWRLVVPIALIAVLFALLMQRPPAPVVPAQSPAATPASPSTSARAPRDPAAPATESATGARVAIHTAAPEVDAGLTLLVTWQDGRPLTTAEVFLTAGETLIKTGRLDERGLFETDALSKAGALAWVVSGQRVLLEVPLEIRAGEIALQVPLGRRLAGTVVIAGAPPGERLELRITDGSGTWPRLPNWLGTALWKSIRPTYFRGAPIWTDELGHFEVLGLADSWRGRLEPPTGLWWTDGGTRHELEAPEVGLVLELEARPMLRGRVVAANGAPASGALVSYALESTDMSAGTAHRSRRTGSVAADADGAFAIPLGPETPRSAHVAASAPGQGFAKLDVELEGLTGHDAGEIRLPATRSAGLLVTGPGGQPIRAARVGFAGGSAEPTGEDGLTTLDGIPLGLAEVWADALGYKRGLATIGVQPASPVELRLEPTTTLDILVLDGTGEPALGMQIALEGGTFLRQFEGTEESVLFELGDFGPRSTEYAREEDGTETMACLFVTDKTGHISTTRILPGVPFSVELQDAAGRPAGWHETLTLSPAEHRHVDVRLEAELQWLTGRITDANLAPLPRASVRVVEAGIDNAQQAEANPAGEFALGPLIGPHVDVWVASYEYAPAAILDHPLGLPLEVVLTAGHELALSAESPDGSTWDLSRASASWGAQGQRVRLSHVPDLKLNLFADAAGCRLESTAPPGATEFIFQLPEPGSASIAWPADLLLPTTSGATIEFQTSGQLRGWLRRPLDAAELESHAAGFDRMLPGHYSFRLKWKDAAGERQTLETESDVEAGAALDLTLAP